MASSGSGYDLSNTTFSPDGRIFQVEYAQKAVDSSGTIIGLHCSDGIVIGVEKVKGSKMLVEGSGRRVHTFGKGMGLGVTGFVSDGRQIVDRARDEAVSYNDTYGCPISPSVLADRVGQYIHQFTLYGSYRPLGVVSLIAARDQNTGDMGLYQIDASCTVFKYFGCAAGKGRQGAKTEIEKLDLTKLTCAEGVKTVAKIIHTLHEEGKDKPFELEMGWLTEANGWEFVQVPKETIAASEKLAKDEIAAMEEEDDEDDDE
ncbi:hypothetical protein ScalyP_jg8729 [Parmales sp. scaly parma]|nr:hypothetical protein ScalyP_jg8729 [Parmales sp. scaly parma]